MTYQPIIIVGAPRSGTNMLRDIVCHFQGVSTWPCDEINYIWRYGNANYASDELPSELACNKVKQYITCQFDWVAKYYEADFVIEKTCANSLRIPFVNRVVPGAKYIYIYRDGIDATGSAKLRWTAKLDIPYIVKKVRFVPLTDLPYYGARYFWSRVYRLFSSEKRLSYWGPALDNMDDILKKHTLDEVCALQWQRCVEKAEAAFADMPREQVIRVCYENFVRNPKEELARILAFMGIEVPENKIVQAVSCVSSKSLSKGRQALGNEKVTNLEALVRETLDRYGYRS